MSEPDTHSFTRPSLLLRIRNADDVEAWRVFVTIYAPLILSYCRSRGVRGADADDVTQEVFTKIMRSIGAFQYEPAKGRFRDWLGTVTHGEICRYMKRVQRVGRGTGSVETQALLDEQVSATPGADWCDRFHAHVLAVALEQIRSQFETTTWEAFERVWVNEQPSSVAAKELGIPLDAVYVAKSRVLKRLREKVLELAEEIPASVASH